MRLSALAMFGESDSAVCSERRAPLRVTHVLFAVAAAAATAATAAAPIVNQVRAGGRRSCHVCDNMPIICLVPSMQGSAKVRFQGWVNSPLQTGGGITQPMSQIFAENCTSAKQRYPVVTNHHEATLSRMSDAHLSLILDKFEESESPHCEAAGRKR